MGNYIAAAFQQLLALFREKELELCVVGLENAGTFIQINSS
jgi:hypothetical protein